MLVLETGCEGGSRGSDRSVGSSGPDAEYCWKVAVRAAQEYGQRPGGTGFTWEHPAHLYLTRPRADSIASGTPDAHRAALASLVDLPPP